jgi:hypothetical protein
MKLKRTTNAKEAKIKAKVTKINAKSGRGVYIYSSQEG